MRLETEHGHLNGKCRVASSCFMQVQTEKKFALLEVLPEWKTRMLPGKTRSLVSKNTHNAKQGGVSRKREQELLHRQSGEIVFTTLIVSSMDIGG